MLTYRKFSLDLSTRQNSTSYYPQSINIKAVSKCVIKIGCVVFHVFPYDFPNAFLYVLFSERLLLITFDCRNPVIL